MVNIKPGVEFTKVAVGGFLILQAIRQVAKDLKIPLTITSACDGVHSGPNDPHYSGEAYDVRTHDLGNDDQKKKVLLAIMDKLGWDRFYGFLEAPGEDREHFHIQVKRNTTLSLIGWLQS